MGTMTFDLPSRLPEDAQAALERASVAGGQDCMPYPTQVLVDQAQMVLSRHVDESGCLLAPWSVNGTGRVMVSSGTLMERPGPYQLTVELARGKINQVRGQSSDWLMGGLVMPEPLVRQIQQATLAFSKAVTHVPDPKAGEEALQALVQGFQAADQLVQAYMNQVFQVRHNRQPHLETSLSCRLYPEALDANQEAAYTETFNAVSIPFAWADVEPQEDQINWEQYDKLVSWAAGLGLPVHGGPLVDFSGRGLPHWLWEKEADLTTMCGYLSDFVERTVERYQGSIRTWQVTAASNWAGVVALADEELLWLTVRLADVIRKMNTSLEVVVGIAQPWGDYLTQQERSQSPFVFADNLMRTGLKVAALDLELKMGVAPRGSYCRDLLDVSRLLDLYALLGVPLEVTLAYPSSGAADPKADPDQKAAAGCWLSGFSPEVQAAWAAAFAKLCVCKPFVRAVHWAHWSDAQPHQLPHCGLVDSQGKLKPALNKLADLRAEHLK
jgi:hypothetical protein